MKIQFLSKTRIHGYGTTQMRCVQPSEYLAKNGWIIGVGCIYRSLPQAQKAIVFHRVTLDTHTKQHLLYAKARGIVTIYDTDDLLFEEDAESLLSQGDIDTGRGAALDYREAMKLCDVVLVSTNYLKKKAEVFHHDVRLVRNGLSAEFADKAACFYRINNQKDNSDITIAYLSGSKHHDQDFKLIEDALIKVLNEFPNTRLLLMGKLNFSKSFYKFGQRFQYRCFVPYAEFHKSFQLIDINIAPLMVGQPFSQARSELKYIEAGVFGVPTIASPTETYCEAITNGLNGMIAGEGEWYESLKSLIVDLEKRHSIGEAARKDIIKNYSFNKRSDEWNNLMVSILNKYGAGLNVNPSKARKAYIRLVYFLIVRRMKIYKRSLLSRLFQGKVEHKNV